MTTDDLRRLRERAEEIRTLLPRSDAPRPLPGAVRDLLALIDAQRDMIRTYAAHCGCQDWGPIHDYDDGPRADLPLCDTCVKARALVGKED